MFGVFEALGSFAYGIFDAVEGATSRELVRVGSALSAAGEKLAEIRPTATVTSASARAYLSASEWYIGLSDGAQAGLMGAAIFTTLLCFVFGMPFVAEYLVGGIPLLPPVPLPSTMPYEDDPSSRLFPEEDCEPQLVERGESAEDEPTIEAYAPSTGEFLGLVPADTPATATEKIARARAAQPKWAATSFSDRRAVMKVLSAYILEEQHDLCGMSMVDTGKTMLDASLGEILTTLEKLRWVTAEGEAVLTHDVRSTGPATMHKHACVQYEPLGVIGAIAPWNYPMHNFFNPVISSLFTGNAIVVKPSEHSVYSSVYFARLIRRALVICGHSADVVQVLVGGPDVGQALVDGDVDKLFFTGSTSVGKKVALAAAKRLLPVVLELGGKDPFIICDDADISHAANMCLRGTYQNAGQNCIGVERVFVHSAVKDAVLEKFKAAAAAIRVGVDMGAITMGQPAIARIQELVDDAIAKGAKLVVGGHAGKGQGDQIGGWFYAATVLDGVRPDMKIAQEEVFGPVLSVFEWSNEKDMIKMVNSSKFGLGSSVFSGNPRRADRILGALRVGMGSVNDYGVHYLCQSLPFGGTKESGSDRFAGIEGLRGCCLAKTVVRDRFPGIKTMLPAHFKYPVYDNAFALSAEISDMMYRAGTLAKADNLRNILWILMSKTWRPRSIGSR